MPAEASRDLLRQVAAAGRVGELQAAAEGIDALVGRLHAAGLPIGQLARDVGALNRAVMARLWTLVAPGDLQRDSALLVMGSEGRGEQLLKTDQDNALLLRDGAVFGDLQAVTERFSRALAAFGYPPCPGGIMLTEPLWQQSVAGMRAALTGWLLDDQASGGEGPMRLAIFCDAVVVAGDATLLEGLRVHLDALLAGREVYLARFAAIADRFDDAPTAWWARLTGRAEPQPLDLKKLGIFPIVHGVRALALQYHLRDTGTGARLERLAALGRIDTATARELLDALHTLMALRLTHQLAQRAAGAAPDHLVQPAALLAADRESLRAALAVVKRFRAWLRGHFNLDAVA